MKAQPRPYPMEGACYWQPKLHSMCLGTSSVSSLICLYSLACEPDACETLQKVHTSSFLQMKAHAHLLQYPCTSHGQAHRRGIVLLCSHGRLHSSKELIRPSIHCSDGWQLHAAAFSSSTALLSTGHPENSGHRLPSGQGHEPSKTARLGRPLWSLEQVMTLGQCSSRSCSCMHHIASKWTVTSTRYNRSDV